MDRKAKAEEMITRRFGVIAAAVANFSMAEKSRPFEPSDFFELEEEEADQLSPEQTLQLFKAMAARMNRGKSPR